MSCDHEVNIKPATKEIQEKVRQMLLADRDYADRVVIYLQDLRERRKNASHLTPPQIEELVEHEHRYAIVLKEIFRQQSEEKTVEDAFAEADVNAQKSLNPS